MPFLVLIQDAPDDTKWSKESIVLSTLTTPEQVQAEWGEKGKNIIIWSLPNLGFLDEWPVELPVDEELDR